MEHLTDLERARTFARRGAYHEAAPLFARHIEESTDDEPLVMIELGFALLLAGDTQGARRLYDALMVIMQKLSYVPHELERLWQRFSTIMTGSRRKLALTGLATVMLAGCGDAASNNQTYSAHRYSGGVVQPLVKEDVVTPATQEPTTPSSTVEPDIEPAIKPFSGHKYSGGVAIPIKDDEGP